jgi:hypothetical protein
VHEFREVLVVEVRARLARVGNDVVRVDVGEPRPGNLDQVVLDDGGDLFGGRRLVDRDSTREEDVGGTVVGLLVRRDQCADSAAEPCALRSHQTPLSFEALSRRIISTAASR